MIYCVFQALNNKNGVVLQGPQGVGKTETVKGLGVALAYFICLTHCDLNMNAASLGKLVLQVPTRNSELVLIPVLISCVERVFVSSNLRISPVGFR